MRSFSLECCSNANPDNTGYGECFDPYALGSCGTDADGNGACTASGSPRPPALLEDLLPVGATVTTITPSQGTCEQPSADKITCDLGALAPDAQATVTIVVSFDAAGEPCNIVSVTSDQIDANPADNDNVDAPLCVTVAGAATCGDPVGPFLTAPGGGYATSMTEEGVTPARVTTATDALFTLQAAVGTALCELCVCDINGSGGLTASDALLTLQLAVGQEVSLDCPPCV